MSREGGGGGGGGRRRGSSDGVVSDGGRRGRGVEGACGRDVRGGRIGFGLGAAGGERERVEDAAIR